MEKLVLAISSLITVGSTNLLFFLLKRFFYTFQVQNIQKSGKQNVAGTLELLETPFKIFYINISFQKNFTISTITPIFKSLHFDHSQSNSLKISCYSAIKTIKHHNKYIHMNLVSDLQPNCCCYQTWIHTRFLIIRSQNKQVSKTID